MSKEIMDAFLAAHSASGYVDEGDFMFVTENATDWIFVAQDSTYLTGCIVGKFSKPTATKKGDFHAKPIAEQMALMNAINLAKSLV